MNKRLIGERGMKKLWAPWRMRYIDGIGAPGATGCIFCDKPAQKNDRANFILARGERCFTIMNIYPYNNGHLMVVPYAHVADLAALDGDTLRELMETAARVTTVMKGLMRPDGFNIGMNIGRTAGAGIADHLHLHVVPRWNGDTNFMPVIGETKVISEALEDTFDKLHRALQEP